MMIGLNNIKFKRKVCRAVFKLFAHLLKQTTIFTIRAAHSLLMLDDVVLGRNFFKLTSMIEFDSFVHRTLS